MRALPKSALTLALLGASSLASAQPSQVLGLNSVHTARSERLEPARETDVGAVEIRAHNDSYQVYALTDVEIDRVVDVHRNRLNQERRANRYSLCTTPCRLVIDRPLLLSVEGVDVPIAPEAQRQRWLVVPERSELRTGARFMAVAGFLGTVVGLVYYSRGATGSPGNPSFRGGVAGIVLGSSLFIASVTAARLLRGRARRVY